MIGHFLLSLTPEEEARMLTLKMARNPTYVNFAGDCGCLRAVVAGLNISKVLSDNRGWYGESRDEVGVRYDELCERFGNRRTNASIRNRVLANIARRTLTPELVPA